MLLIASVVVDRDRPDCGIRVREWDWPAGPCRSAKLFRYILQNRCRSARKKREQSHPNAVIVVKYSFSNTNVRQQLGFRASKQSSTGARRSSDIFMLLYHKSSKHETVNEKSKKKEQKRGKSKSMEKRPTEKGIVLAPLLDSNRLYSVRNIVVSLAWSASRHSLFLPVQQPCFICRRQRKSVNPSQQGKAFPEKMPNNITILR